MEMEKNDLQGELRRVLRPSTKGVDLSPASAFEALLDQRIKDMEHQLKEVKGRVNGVLFSIAGAIILQIVLGLVK